MADRKGLWIALGACGFLVIAGAAFVGLMIFVTVRHLEIRPATTASAEQEYNQLRDRFAGRPPLIEIDRDDPGKVRVHRPAEQQSSGNVTTLHIFAWDRRESKVVKLDLPFWLLRLKPHSSFGQWRWNGEEMNLDNLQITVEDLERYGPGLVLDFEGHRGERVLIWSE